MHVRRVVQLILASGLDLVRFSTAILHAMHASAMLLRRLQRKLLLLLLLLLLRMTLLSKI